MCTASVTSRALAGWLIGRRSLTKGRASYSMELESYEIVPPNVEKEIMSKYKGNTGDDED